MSSRDFTFRAVQDILAEHHYLSREGHWETASQALADLVCHTLTLVLDRKHLLVEVSVRGGALLASEHTILAPDLALGFVSQFMRGLRGHYQLQVHVYDSGTDPVTLVHLALKHGLKTIPMRSEASLWQSAEAIVERLSHYKTYGLPTLQPARHTDPN